MSGYLIPMSAPAGSLCGPCGHPLTTWEGSDRTMGYAAVETVEGPVLADVCDVCASNFGPTVTPEGFRVVSRIVIDGMRLF